MTDAGTFRSSEEAPSRHAKRLQERGGSNLRRWASGPVAYLPAVVLLTLLALWRIPPRAQGVIWAEDGNVFLAQAREPESAWTPFRPYAGYLHFIPRVLTEIVVRFFPLASYAQVITVLSCLAVAVVSVLTFHCAKAVSDTLWIRASWAAIPIFVNVGAIETLGNFANFHWYLLWLTPWLLVKPAKSRLEGGILFAVAAASSLTEIIAVLFVPLFLYRLRDKRFWAARAGLAVGLACQAYTTFRYPRNGSQEHEMEPLSMVYGWFLNTAGPLVFGDSGILKREILNYGPAPVIVASLLVAALAVAVFVTGGKRERLLAAMFILASMAVWAACSIANPAEAIDYAAFNAADWTEHFLFARYSVIPTMFVLALVPLLAQSLQRFSSRLSAAAGVGFALLLVSMFFVPGTFRDAGPVWAEEVEDGIDACSIGHAYAELDTAPSFYKGNLRIYCPDLMQP